MKFFAVLAFLATPAFAADTQDVTAVTCYASNLLDFAVVSYQMDSASNTATLFFGQMGQTEISDTVIASSDTTQAFAANGNEITLTVDKQKTIDLYTGGYIEDDSGLEHHADGLAGHVEIPSLRVSGDVGCTF